MLPPEGSAPSSLGCKGEWGFTQEELGTAPPSPPLKDRHQARSLRTLIGPLSPLAAGETGLGGQKFSPPRRPPHPWASDLPDRRQAWVNPLWLHTLPPGAGTAREARGLLRSARRLHCLLALLGPWLPGGSPEHFPSQEGKGPLALADQGKEPRRRGLWSRAGLRSLTEGCPAKHWGAAPQSPGG